MATETENLVQLKRNGTGEARRGSLLGHTPQGCDDCLPQSSRGQFTLLTPSYPVLRTLYIHVTRADVELF